MESRAKLIMGSNSLSDLTFVRENRKTDPVSIYSDSPNKSMQPTRYARGG